LHKKVEGYSPKVSDHSACVFKDKMYIFGGTLDSETSGLLYEYDFISNYWRQLISCVTNRKFHCTQVYDGMMYVIGGLSDSVLTRKSHIAFPHQIRFNIPLNTWENIGNFKCTGRHFHTVALYGNQLILYGGNTNLNDETGILWISKRLPKHTPFEYFTRYCTIFADVLFDYES